MPEPASTEQVSPIAGNCEPRVELHVLCFLCPENLSRFSILHRKGVVRCRAMDHGHLIISDSCKCNGIIVCFCTIVASVQFTLNFPVLEQQSFRASIRVRDGPQRVVYTQAYCPVKTVWGMECS